MNNDKANKFALVDNEVPFEDVLQNAELKEVFRKYVSQRKKDEQLLFIEQVFAFEKAKDDIVQRCNVAKNVVDTFVNPGSKYEVNVSDELRTKFLTAWKAKAKFGVSGLKTLCSDDNLFARLRTECTLQLKYECYNDFIRSPILEEYLKHKEKLMSAKSKLKSGASQKAAQKVEDPQQLRNNFRRKTIHLANPINNNNHGSPLPSTPLSQDGGPSPIKEPLSSLASSLPAVSSGFLNTPSPSVNNSPLQEKLADDGNDSDSALSRRARRSNSFSSEQLKRRSGMRLSQSSTSRDSAVAKPESSIISELLSKLDAKDPEQWDHEDGAGYMNSISLEEYKQRYASSMDNANAVVGSALESLFEECEITFNAKRLKNILRHEKEVQERESLERMQQEEMAKAEVLKQEFDAASMIAKYSAQEFDAGKAPHQQQHDEKNKSGKGSLLSKLKIPFFTKKTAEAKS